MAVARPTEPPVAGGHSCLLVTWVRVLTPPPPRKCNQRICFGTLWICFEYLPLDVPVPHLELGRALADPPELLLEGGGAPADGIQHPVERAVLGVRLVVHRLELRPLLRRYYRAEVAARRGSVVVVVVEMVVVEEVSGGGGERRGLKHVL